MPRDELFDTLTSAVAEFSEQVLQGEECLLPPSEFKIDPDYRGHGLGSQRLRRMASVLDVEHCLIRLKAFPLADERGDQATPEEVARLQRFYARQGFEPAAGYFMVKDARLWETMKKRLSRRRAASRG